uniref:Uncharacterized protein n=1 Tax=Anguilla anguilla TaxID=7936 RepID=A0A0E9SUI0_ANGAN
MQTNAAATGGSRDVKGPQTRGERSGRLFFFFSLFPSIFPLSRLFTMRFD